jgi:FemAB-related protein (PEP-CTERM system-associated)
VSARNEQGQISVADVLNPPASPLVRSFTADIAQRWDTFVLRASGGSLFHLVSWKRVIEKTFGYRACYIYAERDGEITGVAPVFSISNWVMGQCLLSTPFAVYGGICAADSESENALVQHLKLIAHSERTDYLELRYRKRDPLPDFSPIARYVTFTAPLSSDPEANLKRLPRDTRYMIRKSISAGLRSQGGLDQLGDFYKLFTYSMKRLGTPVFPCALFENLMQEFEGKVDLLLVYSNAKPLAGVFSFIFRDVILPYYAGASAEAAPLAANNFMYWELMKRASAKGIRHFDFGRSKKGTGAYAFKTQWSMNIEPLDYQVHLVRRKDLPNFSPLNPNFELATRLWRKMPLPLTAWIGPRVVRWFP